MLKIVRPSFEYLTNDVRLVNLTKADKKMLKEMGFTRLPTHLQGVEFSYIGKLYQGIGMENDMGGVEFFHQELALRAAGPITCHHPKIKHSPVCCLFFDLWIIWPTAPLEETLIFIFLSTPPVLSCLM